MLRWVNYPKHLLTASCKEGFPSIKNYAITYPMYYPLFLDLSASSCLVIGAGKVGLRKTHGLLQANVHEVLLLDINPLPNDWDALCQNPALRFEMRSFLPEDLNGRSLVFACTNNRNTNASIAKICQENNIFCNCTDAPSEGNCIVPSFVQQGDLTVALSTNGASPALTRFMRKDMQKWLTPYADMAIFLRKLRPYVLALGADTGQNTEIFRAVVHSEFAQALALKNKEQCQDILKSILPTALHCHIAELLHGLL